MKIFTFLIALIIFSLLTIPPESQAKTINKAQIVQTKASADLALLAGVTSPVVRNHQYNPGSPPILNLKSESSRLYLNKKKYGFRVSNLRVHPLEVLKE